MTVPAGAVLETWSVVLTVEDPVERVDYFKGVNQIQVNEKSGLTFARGLRSILRHDPDVILIGEIRDAETAQIAVQASLTATWCSPHAHQRRARRADAAGGHGRRSRISSPRRSKPCSRNASSVCSARIASRPDNSATAQQFKANFGIPAETIIYKSIGAAHSAEEKLRAYWMMKGSPPADRQEQFAYQAGGSGEGSSLQPGKLNTPSLFGITTARSDFIGWLT